MNTPEIILTSIIVTAFVAGYDIAHTPQVKAISEPYKAPQLIVASPSPIPTPTPDLETVEGYIHYKFGEHADKAMKLLTDPRCHENGKLNPRAVNDNRTWGGKGRDRGIFQINDVFHPTVTDDCAFNYRCNIDYAWRMYKNDNYSFKRWTCGRALGL